MEVEHQSRGVAVGDAGGGQINPEHLGTTATAGQREDGHPRIQRSHVGGQIARPTVRKGHHGFLAVVRVTGLHGDNFDHRIANTTCEGLNSKTQTIKKTLMVSAIGSI